MQGRGTSSVIFVSLCLWSLHTQVNTKQDMPEHNVYVPSRKRMARVCAASHPQNIQFLLPRANSCHCNSHTAPIWSNTMGETSSHKTRGQQDIRLYIDTKNHTSLNSYNQERRKTGLFRDLSIFKLK